jgi:hypothetical protein
MTRDPLAPRADREARRFMDRIAAGGNIQRVTPREEKPLIVRLGDALMIAAFGGAVFGVVLVVMLGMFG